MVFRENWAAVATVAVVVSFTIIYLCLKHYCRKEQEDAQIVSSSRSSPETEHPAASYSPYSRRTSRIGFGLDTNEIASSNGYVAPYRPYPSSNEAPSPTETGNPSASTPPYPLSDTMPQPTITSTHLTVPYPLPNISSVPSSADLPPSYAEAMRNS